MSFFWPNFIFGTRFGDTLTGTLRNDFIFGFGRGDVISSGAGNDYVYVDCFTQPPPDDPTELARRFEDSPVVAATTAACGSRVLREGSFDVALVDGQGRIEILENALMEG